MNDGTKYQMTLRTDRQPIEACESYAYPFLFIVKDGITDNASRQKIIDNNPHTFKYKWFRSRSIRPICQNFIDCPRNNSYDPATWNKSAIGGCSLRCDACEKAGVVGTGALFCSANCFKSAWKSHCQSRHTKKFLKHYSSKNALFDETVQLQSPEMDSIDINEDMEQSENVNENEWIACGIDKEYIPIPEDVGCILKVEVTAIDSDLYELGHMVALTDPVLSTPRAPPKRHLFTMPPISTQTTSGARFRVISYNILAELYATKQMYPYSDSWSLSWPYRRAMIQQELDEAQGDVVCMQEVQADHYEQHLNPFMNVLGYDGVFKQKSRESMGQYGKVDGCATFWKRNKFLMIENYGIEFNECARTQSKALGMDENKCRKYMNRLSRDNIAQIFILEAILRTVAGSTTRQSRQMTNICVVNTHLYSNHTRPDVKLWQAMILMREVEQIAVARDVAVIVCGDFNSEPESAVHEFMSKGSLEQPHPELEQSDNLGILPDVHDINHGIELLSTMKTALGQEPLYTNFTTNFKGTLDYIWYTPGRLRVLAVTNIPDPTNIYESGGVGCLPNAIYPSDHILLCTDLAFSVSSTNTTGCVTRLSAQRKNINGNKGGRDGREKHKR